MNFNNIIQRKMKHTLYIVIPAYNEEENIKKLIDDWYPIIMQCGERSKLVVVNDGSTDNTYDILCELAKTRSNLQLLTKQNGGHGSAVLFGYRYAIENNADYIFQTDSDRQTNPSEFDKFWLLREKYDAIIGQRTVRGDGLSRKFVERILCLVLWIIFGIKIKDANAPFRLMKRELVEKYIKKLPEDYNLPNVMLTTYFVYFLENVKFLEITFGSRKGGSNSINIKKIIKIGWKALGEFRILKKYINTEISEEIKKNGI